MGKKMIKTGLSCRVNAKLMLMKCFLSNEATRRLVIEKMKEMGTGGMSVPEECQELLMKEFGMRITSVTRLDDEGLEKVYDRLAQEGRIEKWLNDQASHMKARAEKVLEWEQEEITIDITGFLVYAVLESDRCRKRLMDCMEERGEACCQAYQESVYCDSPLIRWFPEHQRLDAMLCIGLLEQARAENGNKGAYESFIRIASGGYKRVRKYVKQREGIGGKEFQEIMAEMEPEDGADPLYYLSAGVMGLVLAEDLQIPVHMDFMMLSFLPILQEWAQSFLEEPESEVVEPGPAESGVTDAADTEKSEQAAVCEEELERRVQEMEGRLERLRREQKRLRRELTQLRWELIQLRQETDMLEARLDRLEHEAIRGQGQMILYVHRGRLRIPSIPIDIH
ncbi:hypothetical protein [Clostridium sp. AN503]|uniref:hypothetical protein n=1 Tax=Clostridium sp. AN503 TaxID=3160598 RepID=UPI00345AA4BF